MKIEEVRKLAPLDRFLYWIRERHNIYLRRRAGLPKPWTDDAILQGYFFTNPYRENDKVTVWFRENLRDPLRDSPEVIFATACFRWFNRPETAMVLMGNEDEPGERDKVNLLISWDPDEALRRLSEIRDKGGQVFTGAYMINSPGGEPKLEAIIRRITGLWEDISYWTEDLWNQPGPLSMEFVHTLLQKYEGLGGFMAYEVVCDLRYTKLLENTPDKLTWCNPGPGCIRGLYRLSQTPFEKGNNSTAPPRPKDWLKRMCWLLRSLGERMPRMPPFEMREVEHSLCEVDKYERALWNDGKLKRTYKGV